MNEARFDPAPATSGKVHDITRVGSLHPRLAWIMAYNETRNAQEVCNRFGISKKTFYKWLRRYEASKGDSSSLTDQSRRPHRSPNATSEDNVRLLQKVKEETGYGQRRLHLHLQEKYNVQISERTIWKLLKRANGKGSANQL